MVATPTASLPRSTGRTVSEVKLLDLSELRSEPAVRNSGLRLPEAGRCGGNVGTHDVLAEGYVLPESTYANTFFAARYVVGQRKKR